MSDPKNDERFAREIAEARAREEASVREYQEKQELDDAPADSGSLFGDVKTTLEEGAKTLVEAALFLEELEYTPDAKSHLRAMLADRARNVAQAMVLQASELGSEEDG